MKIDGKEDTLPFERRPHEHLSPETSFSSLAREQVHEPAARAPGEGERGVVSFFFALFFSFCCEEGMCTICAYILLVEEMGVTFRLVLFSSSSSTLALLLALPTA